jgi:hypothetical protein
MAEKITVDLEARFGDIEKKLKAVESELKDVGKTAKKTSKGIGGIGKAISGIGAILTGGLFKAGAVIFEKLMELFMSNQMVVTTLNTAMNGLKIVFNDFVGVVVDTISNIGDFGKSIKESIINTLTAAFKPLKLLGEAFMKLLKRDFSGALETLKESGSAVVDNFNSVKEGVNNVRNGFKNGVKAVTDYAKSTAKAAVELTKLNSQTGLAIAENDKLQFIYQRQAEQQRQIRDDVSKSIEERIEANNKLGEVLEEQQTLQLANAQKLVDRAKANLAVDENSIENREALIEAEKNYADVLENIEGFRSEQDVNRVALEQELLDRENAKSEGETKRFIQRKEMAAQEIEDELLRIKTLIEVAEQEKELELERLQNKIDKYKEGTQARVDAEQEYEDFKVASEQKIQDLEKQGNDIKKKNTEEENKRKKALVDAAIAQDQATLGRIAQLAGQGSAIGKAAAVADATIKGIQGVQNAYTTAQSSPITVLFPAYPIVQAGLAAAFSAAQIKSILSTPKPSASGAVGGSSVSVPSGASAPAPPAFNVVGESPENQLAQTIEGRESEPVKAFVVSSDVSSAQALDRNIIENAAIE